MRKYVIMGIQGSGKGTHAKMLAEGFDLEHIAVGDIFRWNVQHHTKLGAQVRRTMAAGLLVGDDLVDSVVKQRLSEHDWNYGFIIDGFPRNERQAEFFLESYDIDGVIHLDLPDSEVARRVLARRLCAGCGMDYSLIDNSPSSDGRCDACGGELIRREDDTEEALAVRLREYHEKTNPCSRSSAARSTSSRWTPGQANSRSSRPSGTGSDCRPPARRRRTARLARGSGTGPDVDPDRA
jgi:adenylate kinase